MEPEFPISVRSKISHKKHRKHKSFVVPYGEFLCLL